MQKKVIDLQVNKKFRLVSVDFKENMAVIHNKEYGYCSQKIDQLRLPFLNRKLTPPMPTIKKFRIALVISVAYFLVWFIELLGYTVVTNPGIDSTMPPFMAWQFYALILIWVAIGIISAIKWRKDIWKAIKNFINNK